MNSTFSIGRLAAGLPKVGLPKITVRHGSKKPRPDPKSIKPPTPPPPFDATYGERIWLFTHTRANHVVYSHTKVIKANKALKQIPFNGKKLRPTTIRKDYWKPLALIEFAQGRGEVGRSVFQKLREFRKRHELEWEDPAMKKMDKKERGRVLNDQKGNTVADMAAVLGGSGKGNKIWRSEAAEREARLTEAKAVTEGKTEAAAEGGKTETKVEESKTATTPAVDESLHEATIYWTNEVDQAYAESWPANVKHVLGFPREKDGVPVQAEQVVESEVAEEAAAQEKE